MTSEHDLDPLDHPGFSAAVLDTIGAIVVVADTSGHIVYANRACQRLTGYSLGELKGQPWERFLAPEEAEAARAVFRSLTAGQFPNEHENDWVTRSGERRCIAWSNTAILGSEGQVEFAIATGTDVTEQRRGERALGDVEERFRELTENIHEVFFLRDITDNRILYVSTAYEKIWGRPVQALYDDPQDFLNYVHPDDQKRVRAAMRDQTPDRLFSDEYRIVRPDGGVRWIRSRTFPVRDANGAFYRVAGLAEDITARRRAEEAVSASEARLRQIIDLVPHMIFVKDWDGRFLLVNKAKADAYGMTVDELTGRLQEELQDCPALSYEQVRADDHEVILSGQPKHIAEESFVDAEGNEHVLETVKVPYAVAGSDRPAVLGVAADITDRLRMAQELAREAERYRLVVDTMAEGVVLIGADGCFRAGNAVAARMVGRSLDDLVGRPFFPQTGLRRIDESGHAFPLERHPIAVTLRTGQLLSDVVMGLVREDETVLWLSITTRPTFRDGDPVPDAVVVSLADITAQKNAEAALRASEDRLRRSQICANIGTWDLELHTGRLHWSERVAPMLGYVEPIADTVIDKLMDVVHPDDIDNIRKAIRSCVEEGTPYMVEYRAVWPDGTVRWMLSQGDVDCGADGEPVRLLGAVQDITERKWAEQALRASEEKYRALMENASDAIFICGLDGKLLDANKRAEQLLGYTKDELLGLHASDIHPPEEEESLRAAFEDIVGKGRSLYEHLVLRKDGGTTSVEVAGTLFEYRGRQVALGIFRDLAERKLAELTHAKLSRALEQTADSVMITDAHGVIEYVNPEFEKTTGYGRDEVIGMTPRILRSGRISREFYRRMWEDLSAGRVFRAVVLNRKKDGALFYEDMAISPLRDERGCVSHFISVSRDVTASRRAEEERLARERVHRDTLVREVHHRIKNHLQGLSGLLRKHATERPELRDPLEAVIAQIHSVAVVHGLQGTAGHGDVRLCDMTEAICRAGTALSGGRVELQLEMDLKGSVSLAPEEAVSIALIINEMIVNAIKHGEHAAGPVRVRVIGGGQHGEVVVINRATELEFDAVAGGGTGLTLVRALLPRVGAEFAVEATPDGCVEARLAVSPPVVVASGGKSLGG